MNAGGGITTCAFESQRHSLIHTNCLYSVKPCNDLMTTLMNAGGGITTCALESQRHSLIHTNSLYSVKPCNDLMTTLCKLCNTSIAAFLKVM